jgi:hypothetical protein
MVLIRRWRRVQHQGVVIMSLLSCASRGVVRRCLAFTAALATASGTRCFSGRAAPDEIGLIEGWSSVRPICVPLVRGANFIVCS